MAVATGEDSAQFPIELTRSGDVRLDEIAEDSLRGIAGRRRRNVTGDLIIDVHAVGPRIGEVLLPDADGRLLERVGLVLNSTLELPHVLASLSEVTLDFTGSDSCGVLLLRNGKLHPTIGIGAAADDERWKRFLAMDPIELDDQQWAFLHAGRAIAFDDATTTPAITELVPKTWLHEFDIRALALVPLLAANEPCGLMAVDWRAPRTFELDEIRLLEAIASHAGVAVANARLFGMVRRRAQLQSALAKWAGILASPFDPEQIAARLVDAYSDLLPTRMCTVALLDDARTSVRVASRGGRHIEGPLPLASASRELKTRLRDEWSVAKRPVEVDDDPWLAEVLGGRDAGAAWYLLLPLSVAGHWRGAVVLGFAQGAEVDDDEREAAEALADIAAAAMERHDLVDRLGRQLRQLDALHRVSAALTEGADARHLVDELNDLLKGHGIEVVGITFRDRRLSRKLGGDEATPEERTAWRGRARAVTLPDGNLSLPMRVGSRVVGMLRVKPAGLDAAQRTFVDALARGLGEVVYRGALRDAVEEAARARAVAADRERMADDLHDTAGQVFVAIGLLARRQANALSESTPEAKTLLRLADLADGGKWEIEQAVRALTFVPAPRRGFVPSIRALAASVQADSGIHVSVEVVGEPVRLDPKIERALYRVFHQAITNAWRHAQCRAVRAVVRYTDRGVRLSVRDDGVGLTARPQDDRSHMGLAAMRRAVADVGGTVHICNADPTGVLVDATAPWEAK